MVINCGDKRIYNDTILILRFLELEIGMEIFIGNLSANAKLIEIHHILGAHQMHSDFTTFEGKDCDHRQYHFVIINAKSEENGHTLIKQLNGLEFYGKSLEVREYIHRNVQKQTQWKGDDRRINEQMPLEL